MSRSETALHSELRSKTGVVDDFMSDQQSASGIRKLVEGAGPRVQIDLLFFVKLPDAVVKAAQRQGRRLFASVLIELGERAILRRPRGRPFREVGKGSRLPCLRPIRTGPRR